MSVKTVLSILLAAFVTYGFELKYSELQRIGASCPPYDTCSIAREDENLRTHRCLCNAKCIRSKTCCIDSPHVRVSQKGYRTRGTCQQVGDQTEYILAVSYCDPRWRGSREIRSKCENSTDSKRDPMSIVPLTNLKNGITYKNFFCAYCNNDQEFSIPWSIRLVSPFPNSEREALMEKLVFNEERGEWGVFEKEVNGEEVFHYVSLSFEPKIEMKDLFVPCFSDNIVSDCDPSWRDISTRKMCRAYMAFVYLDPDPRDDVYDSRNYRNIHCAICNNVILNNTNLCYGPITGWGAGGFKPSMSLVLLLDINLSDGDQVGSVNRCGRGEVYDAFFKKCRAMKCAFPGYTIKDNKCVKP